MSLLLPPPNTPGRQIVAGFEKDSKDYAFSIGSVSDGNYSFYSDDVLIIPDPHEVYKHWPLTSGLRSTSTKRSLQ